MKSDNSNFDKKEKKNNKKLHKIKENSEITKRKNLEKLKALDEKTQKKERQKLIAENKLPISELTDEEYREYLKTIETYFQVKSKLLQYLFPYIIEYGKMQSKFTTTRYNHTINLVVPFIRDFHHMDFNYDVLNYYPLSIQYKEENDFLLRNKHHSRKEVTSQCIRSNFHLYKFFYYKIQELLYNQKKAHDVIVEKTDPDITDLMTIQYDKLKYYRYPTYIWSIIFQDPIIEKFTNLFVKHGKKEKAEKVIMRMFLHFHNYLHVNPLFMFKEAIENVRPYVCSKSIPFGRRTKVVPHPIGEKQQIKLAMKWIKHDCLNIKGHIPLHFKLMDAFINAYKKRGYAYNQMLSMHNDAYSQRAYMYSNYYLRTSKVKHKRPF